jgi:hypothetical protein
MSLCGLGVQFKKIALDIGECRRTGIDRQRPEQAQAA